MARRLRAVRARGEQGMATAEYAVATIGACGFGTLLIRVLTSQPVADLLLKWVSRAFSFAF